MYSTLFTPKISLNTPLEENSTHTYDPKAYGSQGMGVGMGRWGNAGRNELLGQEKKMCPYHADLGGKLMGLDV